MREVVLVNGWGMRHPAWSALAAALPLRGAVHAIDLDADILRPGSTLEDAAARVAARAPDRCRVVGWSLGAQIALQWAAQHPGQVEALALVAATPCFVARADWPHAMDEGVFERFRAQFEADPEAALGRFTLLEARGEADPLRVARMLREALCDAGVKPALQAGLDLLRQDDLRGVLSGVRQPSWLVQGARDELVPHAAAAWLERAMPDGRLHTVAHAAHAPHVSHPAEVAAALADFLE